MCIVFSLFFLNRDRIESTLEETGFLTLIKQNFGFFSNTSQRNNQTDDNTPTLQDPSSDAVDNQLEDHTDGLSNNGQDATDVQVPPDPDLVNSTENDNNTQITTRTALLYFVKVDDDGVITRHEVKRSIPASDSPLKDTISALLKGPNDDEMGKGLMTLIPAESRILSVRVRDSIAYINFNEAFMYNKYGIEGYAGQLRQIVYSATTFPTVKYVQFLIEGRIVDYLGGEGIFVGKPVSRTTF